IDRAIASISSNADTQIQRWLEEERFLAAVTLSQQLVAVDPTREEWARGVQTKAIDFFQRGSDEALEAGFPGTAAVRLSIAADLGASVRVKEVESLWAAFRTPNCFAKPKVRVRSSRKLSKKIDSRIRAAVMRPLSALQSRCGTGGQPLNMTVNVERAKVIDDRSVSTAFEPLPGVEIETEEVYFEEEPYVEVEEITTYETRIETVEHRDCAPRPGQRGCRTWTEEVEKRIPKVEKREVRKTRRVRKTRPIRTPPPKEKVVRFQQTTAQRGVLYQGTLSFLGAAEGMPFAVNEESRDIAHGAVNERGVVLPKDALEIDSLDTVYERADKALEREVERAIQSLVAKRSAKLEAAAGERVREGKREAAEEAYLSTLVIGGSVNAPMARFFNRRYGRPVPEVMTALLRALGRVAPKEEEETASDAGLFPDSDEVGANTPEPSPGAKPPSPQVEAKSDEADLDAMREASIEAAQDGEAEPAPVVPGGEDNDSRAPVTPDAGDDPERAPVAPADDESSDERSPVRPDARSPVVPSP
ncbi:MAG: hypothetical protein AAF658_14180, partial [Myxococcota bacterium]